jgi:hypothetical protein
MRCPIAAPPPIMWLHSHRLYVDLSGSHAGSENSKLYWRRQQASTLDPRNRADGLTAI